ncbi:MAG: hypothetical protein SNG35_01975 [Rikenellaceae bacterium]
MKRLLSLAVMVAMSLSAYSQSVLSTKEMVSITPVLGSEIQLPEQGKKMLSQKLTQITTQNGFGATHGGGIVLTANVVVMNSQATATVPPMIAVEAELSLVLLNISEKIIIDELTIPLRGIDSNKDRALIKAINTLSPRSTEVRRFMTNCRTKVLDYYTTRVPIIIANANSLVERREYDQAMAILATIPNTVDEYPVIADMMVEIYIKRLDITATDIINRAQLMESRGEFNNAMEALLRVDQSSTLYPTALKRIESIQQRISDAERKRVEEQIAAKQREMDSELAQMKAQLQGEHDEAMKQMQLN